MPDFNTRLSALLAQYPNEDPDIVRTALEMQDAEQAMPRGLNFSREKGLSSVIGNPELEDAPYSQQYSRAATEAPAFQSSGSDIDELRAAIPKYRRMSDAGVALDISKEYGISLEEVAAELGVRFDTPGFKTSIDRLLGMTAQGIGQGAEDLLGLKDNALKLYGQNVVLTNPSGINSLQDIADKPGLALQEGAGNLVGFLGPQLGLGLIGKAAAAYGAARTGAALGGFAGQTALAGLPSYGGVREEQTDAGKNEPTDMLRAAGVAAGVGAIENLFGIQKMLGIGRTGTTTLRDTIRGFGDKPLSTAARTAVSGAAQEGAEELVQSPMEQWGAYRDPASQENVNETILSGAMGAIGGLVGGAGVGAYRGVQHSAVANELSPYMVDPGKKAPTDLLAAAEARDYQQYLAPIQEDAQEWNQLRNGVIPASVAAEMPSDESSPGAEFQWNQPARTKEDVEAAFNTPVGSVGGKTITAFDEYKAAHPELFGKQKQAKQAATVTATTPDVSNETARAVTLIRAAGLKPSAPRVQIVAEAQKLEAQGVLTRDEVDDIVNRITDSKQYEKVRSQLAEKTLAAERTANPPTTPEAQRAEVQKMLASLSEEERAVLTQYTYDKQTFEQIADNLSLKNKQKAQRTFEWAKKKLARKAAEFGVPASKIDEIFPNENNSLQGGADVQTVTAAELAQTGAAMHVPGEVVEQNINETQNIDGEMQFGDAPVFDEESHLRRGEVEEGAAPVEGLVNTYVDHLGIPLKQEDIDDAGVEYDGVASRVGAPLYASLDTPTKVRATKAYAAYMDETIKLPDFKRILKDIANEQLDGKREATEETVTPDVPQEPSGQRETESVSEAEVEQGSGEPTLEAQWNAYAAANDFPTWSALSDEQKTRVETAAATGDEQLIGDTVVAVAEELLGLRTVEATEQVAGVAADQKRVKQLEASIKQAEKEQDTTRADWAKKELATVSAQLNNRIGATPIKAMIVWDNTSGRVSEAQFAPFREVLQKLADHPVLGFHAKRLSAIRVIDGTSSHMWYDVDNNEIHIPEGWFTEAEYQQGGILTHERTRVFLHELGHSIDLNPTGFDRFSAHPLFRSASKVDAGGLLYYPRGGIATEVFRLWNHSKKSLTGAIMSYPLEPGDVFEQKYMKQYEEVGKPIDVSQPIQREVFAQLFSMYYSDQYGYKNKGGKTAKELLAEEAPNAFKVLGEINEILRRDSTASETEAKNQGRTFGPTLKAAGPNQGAAARSADAQGGVVAGAPMRDLADTIAPAVKSETGDFWAKMKPKLLTIHQLVDQYGAKLQSLKNYVKTVDSMEQFQQQLAVGAHDIVMNWQKLPKAMQKSLNRVMLDATMWGIHPDKPFGSEENRHLTAADRYRYDDLKNRYNALPANARVVYSGARDYLASLWDQRSTVFADLVRTSYAKLIARDPDNKAKLEAKRDRMIDAHDRQVKSVKGPYFPLLRFGDYLTIGKSKELAELEAKLADETTTGRAKIEEKILALKKDSKHYAVYASEHKSAAEAKAQELERAGLTVRTQLAESHPNALMPFSASGMERLRSLFDSQFDRGTANKLDKLLTELYINSLPEHTALQRQLKRIGVEGAEENSLRAFARAVEQDSFHLSRMKFNDEITNHLFHIDAEAKAAGIEYQHVANNLKARIDLDFQYQRTPVLSMLGRLSSFWHLGVSPAYLFTNATQPWMIALPSMAGKFGFAKTMGAMKNSWNDAKNMIVQSKKDGAFADIKFDVLPNLNERKMLQTIRNLGQIDITINFDLGNTAETISPAWLKLQKSLAWANHHIEVSNRITTALTAYRLAVVAGMDHEAASDYAYKQVIDTQLDYSNANAAYFMKSQHLGGLNKLIMQFRKYQQGMFYLLAQNAKLAFAGDKQAMRAFAYLMAMQGVFAGMAGVPFMSMALFAAGLGIGDDDPEGDAETQFRNFLADALGPDAARVFYKGLPAMIGMDVSKRIGLGDIWDPTPFYDMKDFNKAKTGKEAVSGALFALAGPAVGTMSNFADAAVLAESGQLNKAAEKMLPKVLADLVRATRYGSEGLTTRAGKPILSDESFSAGDLAQRALGFAPLKETEYYSANAAKMDTQQAIKDRRDKLIAGWARYQLLGDYDNVAAMNEAVANWNAKHPNKGERIDRSALIRAVQERRKSVNTADSAGVQFKKNEQYLKEIDRYAR